MVHSSHDEVLTDERLEEYKTTAAHIWLFVRFRDEGLSCLEKDGTIGGRPGLEVMNRLLNYFLSKERYERCAVMHDRIAEHQQQKFPKQL